MDLEASSAEQGAASAETADETLETQTEDTGHAEAQGDDGAEAGGDGEGEAGGDPSPQAEPERPKHKVPLSVQKRIDKALASERAATERAESLDARIKALEAQISASGGELPQEETRAFTAEDIQRAASDLVARQTFDQKCNTAWENGSKEFGAAWEDNVGLLRSMGVIQVPFLEAVMETAAPEKVLNALGEDPDEAVRIAALTPTRRAIELERLATKLAKPAKPQVSSAPPPIRTIEGSGRGAPDVYDPNISDDEYYALREKERQAKFGGR